MRCMIVLLPSLNSVMGWMNCSAACRPVTESIRYFGLSARDRRCTQSPVTHAVAPGQTPGHQSGTRAGQGKADKPFVSLFPTLPCRTAVRNYVRITVSVVMVCGCCCGASAIIMMLLT